MLRELETERKEKDSNDCPVQRKNDASVSHKISLRARPEIQAILEKSRRWREDCNYQWV